MKYRITLEADINVNDEFEINKLMLLIKHYSGDDDIKLLNVTKRLNKVNF